MKDRIFLSDSQIKKILSHLKRLSASERVAVSEILHQLKASGVGREEFHRELYQMEKNYQISETHAQLVESVLFDESI